MRASPARLPVLRLSVAALVLGPALLRAGESAAANDHQPEVMRSGRYQFRYFGRDVGEEHFTIERRDGGYLIRARVMMKVGEQVPSESVYVLDDDRRFVSATYRELTGDGDEAAYRLDGDVLVVEAVENGRRVQERLEVGADAIITGPHYVTDFFVLQPLGLDIKDRSSAPAYAFGFKGWRVSRVELDSRREPDKRMKDGSGRAVDTVVYRCRIRTSDDTFKTRSWLDEDGVSVRITVGAPIGHMDVRLDGSPG